MAAAKTYITYRDHLLRSSALIEYAHSQIELSAHLMAVMALNYPTLSVKWLEWGSVLASLLHQMEGQSQSLYLMALEDTKDTAETRMSSRSASTKYYANCEGKNDREA